MDEPATAQMLNAVPRILTPADFQHDVVAFDRVNHHLLGVFRRSDEDLSR